MNEPLDSWPEPQKYVNDVSLF